MTAHLRRVSTRVQCNNSEKHYSHHHPKVMTYFCSGLTSCGERSHEPHDYNEEVMVFCHGLCNCSATRYGGPHGPGEHK